MHAIAPPPAEDTPRRFDAAVLAGPLAILARHLPDVRLTTGCGCHGANLAGRDTCGGRIIAWTSRPSPWRAQREDAYARPGARCADCGWSGTIEELLGRLARARRLAA